MSFVHRVRDEDGGRVRPVVVVQVQRFNIELLLDPGSTTTYKSNESR